MSVDIVKSGLGLGFFVYLFISFIIPFQIAGQYYWAFKEYHINMFLICFVTINTAFKTTNEFVIISDSMLQIQFIIVRIYKIQVHVHNVVLYKTSNHKF